jgi:hypothetical protein
MCWQIPPAELEKLVAQEAEIISEMNWTMILEKHQEDYVGRRCFTKENLYQMKKGEIWF